MSSIDEWWSEEQRKREYRERQLSNLQSSVDHLQEISESPESKQFQENQRPPSHGESMTINEWLLKQGQHTIEPVSPNDQSPSQNCQKVIFQTPKKKSTLIQRIKCLFGLHDWGRWIYADSLNKTELKRECNCCNKLQNRIAETNDLAD